jgi:2-methylisocitrate lyase-like PEP mutase family enzyme
MRAGNRQQFRARHVIIVRITLGGTMSQDDQAARAARFRDLNLAGRLLLPNAWDAASARVFEDAGFLALGTTSAGIANARGLPDGECIGRDEMVREIASIVRAVDRPVSADIEAGYGHAPGDVAATVQAVLDAGVVGINLEDNAHRADASPLYSTAEQAARIRAARDAADERRIPMVINARTDSFLLGLGADLDERIEMTIERGRAYLQAGADLVFVPVLVDPEVVRRVTGAITGPVSLMAMPGAPAARVLFDAGASRVSLGNSPMLATLGTLREIAREVLDAGTWTAIERTFYGFGDAAALFARR